MLTWRKIKEKVEAELKQRGLTDDEQIAMVALVSDDFSGITNENEITVTHSVKRGLIIYSKPKE